MILNFLMIKLCPLFLLSCTNPQAMPPVFDPHFKSAEEVLKEYEEEDPSLNLTKRILDIIDPENAPHTIEDAKNLA